MIPIPVTAGVSFKHLKVTKLGLIFFLIMVKDLTVNSPDSSMWEFVHDVSTSKHDVTPNATSITQFNSI